MTGSAESCINFEKKVRVNIVNFSTGKKEYIICDDNGYSLSTVSQYTIYTGPPGTREGLKGRKLMSVQVP